MKIIHIRGWTILFYSSILPFYRTGCYLVTLGGDNSIKVHDVGKGSFPHEANI